MTDSEPNVFDRAVANGYATQRDDRDDVDRFRDSLSPTQLKTMYAAMARDDKPYTPPKANSYPAYTDGQGRTVYATNAFNRDDNKPVMQLPPGYGNAKSFNAFLARRRLLTDMKDLGVGVPADLVREFAVHDAIQATAFHQPSPVDLNGVDPAEVPDMLRVYADQVARISALSRLQDQLTGDSYDRIRAAAIAAVDTVLADKNLRTAFDTAAREFEDAYPVVRGCTTLSEAAVVDETGAGVASFHIATNAVQTMNRVSALILGLRHSNDFGPSMPSRTSNPSRTVTLAGPVPTGKDDVVTLNEGVTRFKSPNTPTPWDVYGALVDSQVSLSLPGDRAEWDARQEAFSEARSEALRVTAFGSVVFPDYGDDQDVL